MTRLLTGLCSLFIMLILCSCGHDPLDADVSDVKVQEVKLLRLDKDVFSLNQQNLSAKLKSFEDTYGAFYKNYNWQILNLPDTSGAAGILNFVNNPEIRQVYEATEKAFPDAEIQKLEKDLTDCLKRFAYFFPDRKKPQKFVSFISGFNYKVTYADSVLGIGLDMYLGHDHQFYKMLQWPQYQTRRLSKEYIMPDVARGWMITEFDTQEPVNNLLNHIIFYGKVLYACDALLPEMHDSLKMGYSTAQMKYCKEYERQLWGHFAEKNRLYENNLKVIADYTSDGPFTGVISKECPPQIGIWIGWQIVRSYMKNNENVTVGDLMKEKDAQKILSKSKYRP